jgi:hypothetical protein
MIDTMNLPSPFEMREQRAPQGDGETKRPVDV